ncbi:brachyurin-like [Culicoides brevitarsis]|uniref:brachyurin-like n=1 Tax=Culicoides brevitarsis TaxID=469753 RepID=UPI00307BA3D7
MNLFPFLTLICCLLLPSCLAIFGGSYVTDQTDYRFQVSIRLKHFESSYGNGYMCSGTIISKYSILTSAQCVYHYQDNKIRDPKEFRIVMGSLWRSKFYPTLLERDIAKITIHKSFNSDSSNHENDLAILRLVTALPQVARDIAPIELRASNNTNNLIGKISSWGDTNPEMPTEFSDVLKKIDVSVQTADKCRNLIGTLAPGQLCVTTRTNGSTCYGDLGAPFIVDRQLVGFVSEEKACGLTSDQPIVLTSVAYHKRWIDANAGVNLKSFSVLTTLLAVVALIN